MEVGQKPSKSVNTHEGFQTKSLGGTYWVAVTLKKVSYVLTQNQISPKDISHPTN